MSSAASCNVLKDRSLLNLKTMTHVLSCKLTMSANYNMQIKACKTSFFSFPLLAFWLLVLDEKRNNAIYKRKQCIQLSHCFFL